MASRAGCNGFAAHIWPAGRSLETLVYISDICSEKNFVLYTSDSDYPDTSLFRHYLTKQSMAWINEV